jgi:hypothetical protein
MVIFSLVLKILPSDQENLLYPEHKIIYKIQTQKPNASAIATSKQLPTPKAIL